MTLRPIRISAAFVFSTALLASFTLAPTPAAAQESAYGGSTVEQIIARVNDQIITTSDYNRALKDLNDEETQRGASMQEASEARQNLLRNLIDQQLWLSKGKELDITGETELIERLDQVRKQYHLATMEDLEKAAQQQGVSYEDFKANIRNQIITQDVMRQEVGQKIQFTPGEARRYFEAHAQNYAQPESVTLAEILVSTGTSADGTTDPAKLAEAKSKADNLEAKLHAGGDFAQLARTFSDGTTAAEGGDLGTYQRGTLAKVLEDKTFALEAGQYTDPIRTRQGYVIFEVEKHTPGGIPPYKNVENKVEDDFYMSRMEPAIRAYLTTMREQAFIDIKPGYTDTGASPNETKPVFSAYVPPSRKKKRKVERTRFRENAHRTHRKTSPEEQASAAKKQKKNKKEYERAYQASMKPGKKEKIRFGQAPTETLPSAQSAAVEDAGAVSEQASTTPEPVNPLEPTRSTKKTRFSARAKTYRKEKVEEKAAAKKDAMAPPPPDAEEVADRQTQDAPLGLGGNTAHPKKQKATTTGEKTRMADTKATEKTAAKKKSEDAANVHGWW